MARPREPRIEQAKIANETVRDGTHRPISSGGAQTAHRPPHKCSEREVYFASGLHNSIGMAKERKGYASDVADGEWEFCAPCLSLMREDAPPRDYRLRDGFKGVRYIVRSGCQRLVDLNGGRNGLKLSERRR